MPSPPGSVLTHGPADAVEPREGTLLTDTRYNNDDDRRWALSTDLEPFFNGIMSQYCLAIQGLVHPTERKGRLGKTISFPSPPVMI